MLERYDFASMRKIRLAAIEAARSARRFGLILGTLGRQGSLTRFSRLQTILRASGRRIVPFLMSELMPSKLNIIPRSQVSHTTIIYLLVLKGTPRFHS
jgi:2-(3-amino-3-carboxypropyl)histidine synthase